MNPAAVKAQVNFAQATVVRPTTPPLSFAKLRGIQAMLELDIKMEEENIADYMKHAGVAYELGMVELKMKLEEIAADEAGRARMLSRLVKGL